MSKMKHAILVAALWSTALQAVSVTKQHFVDTFSHIGPDAGAGIDGYCNCTNDGFPGPVKALTWNNLGAAYTFGKFTSGQLVSVFPYDGPFYAVWNNSSEPAVISSRYRGSCVWDWKLESFAFGCSADQKTVINGQTVQGLVPSNCTVNVEGFGRDGQCVGREVFHYAPYPLPFHTVFGVDYGKMALFNMTNGGLRHAKLAKIKISAKVSVSPGNTYVGLLGLGIDAVSYTVFNRTGCRSGL